MTRRGWRSACAQALLGAAAASCAQAQAGPSAQLTEPRAYGYFVGDLLQRRLHLNLPPGWLLDLDSLPRTRRPGQALELRRVDWQGGRELLLEYQVFAAPTEVRTLEAPPLKLRFTGPGGEQWLRVEAWPVTVAPLVPLEASPRNGLGEMRPDAPPPLLDTRPAQRRLLAYAALLLLACAYLAHVYLGLPWLRRRQRPFAQAWRQLRGLPADATAGSASSAAYTCLHAALNASAGRVLFAAGVDSYLSAQPRYAALRGELLAFFAASNARFFGEQDAAADTGRLLDLARALRDAERGS